MNKKIYKEANQFESDTNITDNNEQVSDSQTGNEACADTPAPDTVENESRDSILSNLTSTVLGQSDDDIEFFE